mmetsp:Transcript_20630/g.48124  ORF Transcript_20630/g.48124 Transcript_20630/m.48124 type:complete len:214 (+) Transcript_20630:1322-1963(+)
MINLVFSVLVHHTLHDLDRQLHVLRISWVRVGLLFLLGNIVIHRLATLLVFLFFFLCGFNVSHVLIEDLPLCHGATIPGRWRRLSGPTPFAEQGVFRLRGALGEVKLVAQGILDRIFLLVFGRVEVFIDGFRLFLLVLLCLLFLQNLHLVHGFGAVLQEDETIPGEVHHDLIHLLVHLEALLLERVLRRVVRGLRVQRIEYPGRHLFLKLLRL